MDYSEIKNCQYCLSVQEYILSTVPFGLLLEFHKLLESLNYCHVRAL